jgi:Sulfotransferase domain
MLRFTKALGGAMKIAVVGAGVGRTGTHSLKLALEQLLDAPCHHMVEMFGDPVQIAAWTDAIDGRPVDWTAMLSNYGAIVDWPGGSFWPELSAANPDALVLLSVRDPESWYRSASNTIFSSFDTLPPTLAPWMDSVRRLLHDRFSDRFDDPTAMMDAFVQHNDAVRAAIPADRLLEWTVTDGWDPICERLGLPVPAEQFPVTNSTEEFRAMAGMAPIT